MASCVLLVHGPDDPQDWDAAPSPPHCGRIKISASWQYYPYDAASVKAGFPCLAGYERHLLAIVMGRNYTCLRRGILR